MAAAPAVRPEVLPPASPAGGLPPFGLDPAIAQAAKVLEDAAALVADMLPTARQMYEAWRGTNEAVAARLAEATTPKARDTLRKEWNVVVRTAERLGRLLTYLSRVLDESSRLRAFLAGEPTDRRALAVSLDYADVSEAELRTLVLTQVEALLRESGVLDEPTIHQVVAALEAPRQAA